MKPPAGQVGCRRATGFEKAESSMSEAEANALKRRFSPALMKLPGVCGVGVEKAGAGFSVVVHLCADDEAIRKQLPADLDGKQYQVIASGPFTKYGAKGNA
jgi:hypothetical protein